MTCLRSRVQMNENWVKDFSIKIIYQLFLGKITILLLNYLCQGSAQLINDKRI